MNNPNASLLQDIIQIARDGAAFYDAARSEVRNPALKETFARMAGHKRDLIAALGGRLQAIGETVPDGGTLVGALRKAYADVRATLSSDEEAVYVRQLEETEDRLLEHVLDAISRADDPMVRNQLESHLRTVRACHDEMRTLKQRWAA